MERKERYFHECPHCGLLTPWVQRKCDCGYVFQRAAPARSGVSVPVFVLSVLLALAVGLMAAGWRGTQPVSVVVSEAPAASAAPVSSAPAKSSFSDWSNQNVSPTPAPTIKPTPAPTPAPRPVLIFNGTIVKDTTLDKPAPLTVETSGLSNYFVYLKCIGRPSTDGLILPLSGKYADMSFYVAGGQTVDVDVPLGKYEIWYATGSTWYGEDFKFGEGTRFYKCDETFSFLQTPSGYSGWTVTLYPVYNGNMETEEVDAADFPG